MLKVTRKRKHSTVDPAMRMSARHILLCIMRTRVFVCIICETITPIITPMVFKSLYLCIVHILVFPSKIWPKKCTLYMAKCGICGFFSINTSTVFVLQSGVRGCGRPTVWTVLCHFTRGTWAATDLDICSGGMSWNQSLTDTEGS